MYDKGQNRTLTYEDFYHLNLMNLHMRLTVDLSDDKTKKLLMDYLNKRILDLGTTSQKLANNIGYDERTIRRYLSKKEIPNKIRENTYRNFQTALRFSHSDFEEFINKNAVTNSQSLQNCLQVVLLDDNELLRDSFAALLEKTIPNANILKVANYDQAITILIENVNISFAFLDIELNHSSAHARLSTIDLLRDIKTEESLKTGIGVLKFIRENDLKISVIMLSDYDDIELINTCLKEGATGYIPKSKYSKKVLLEAVDLIFNGGVYLPFPIKKSKTLEEYNLDDNQKKLLTYLCLGYRCKMIEKELGRPWNTLKRYASELYKIFNVTGKAELQFKIAELGIILPPPNQEN